jgi:hypothetical protein
MELHKIKKLQHNQGNDYQFEEAAHILGENLCQLYISQGINNQHIQGAQKLNSQKINDPMKKWAKELNPTFSFSKEEVQVAKTHEILNIPGHKGNANQNHIKILPHHIRKVTIKKTKNNKCWQGCGEIGTCIHCLWECFSTTTMENIMEAP